MIGEGDRESQAGGPAYVKGVGAGVNRNGEGTPGTTDWTRELAGNGWVGTLNAMLGSMISLWRL